MAEGIVQIIKNYAYFKLGNKQKNQTDHDSKHYTR